MASTSILMHMLCKSIKKKTSSGSNQLKTLVHHHDQGKEVGQQVPEYNFIPAHTQPFIGFNIHLFF